jgi:hypothetical protein
MATALGWVYINLSPAISGTISMCVTSTIMLFLFLYSKELAIAFCRHKERIPYS